MEGQLSEFLPAKLAGEPHRPGTLGRPDSHIEAVRGGQQPPLSHQDGSAAVLPAPQPQAHLPRPLPATRGAAAHDPGHRCHRCQAAVCREVGDCSAAERTDPLPSAWACRAGLASSGLGDLEETLGLALGPANEPSSQVTFGMRLSLPPFWLKVRPAPPLSSLSTPRRLSVR